MKELIILSALGVLSLIAGLLRIKRPFMVVVIAGLLLNIGFCIMDWNHNENLFNMMTLDNFALAFTILSSSLAILWFIVAHAYFQNSNTFSDHYALVLFAMTGGLLMVSFTNMVMLFLGIEVLSIPLFVLAGSHKTSMRSNEAAFKYFLLGAFASAFLLFGIALLYGSTGHFDNAGISAFLGANKLSGMALAGIILMLGAMTFKVSAAPFHFWAPDVYQGSPTMITTFMATFVKTVAFAGFFRLFFLSFMAVRSEYAMVFAVIAALTILVSNLIASAQSNVKRLLAYSSISHAGFMVITLLCMNNSSAGVLLYYTLVYSISSIIAFSIFKWVKTHSTENEEISAFNGLLRRSPLLAVVITLALLSMSGIPPLSGFMAKYMVFTAAITNGYMWVAICGIAGSLMAVYYYFKIIMAMFADAPETSEIKVPGNLKFVLIVCSIALIALMLFPSQISSLI